MTVPWLTLLGVSAAACSTGSFLPQALKIIRERDASSVSLKMYIVSVTGFLLWSAYGVTLQSLPLIGSNLIGVGMSAWILILKLRLRRA